MNKIAGSLLGAVAALGAMGVGGTSGRASAAAAAPAVDRGMTTITDDLGLLRVAVPNAWTELATAPMESDTGTVIARLAASTDAEAFANVEAPGVFLQSAPTLVDAPALIDDLTPEQCGRSDGLAEWIHPDVTAGSIDVFDCGPTLLHIAAGNIVGEERSMAVMVQLMPVDAGMADQVLASVDYLGNGPNTSAPAPEPTEVQPTAAPAPTAPQPTPSTPAAPAAAASTLDVAGAQAGLQRFFEAVPHRGVSVACPLVNHQVLAIAMSNNGITMGGNRWSAGRTVVGAIDNHPALRCFEPDGVGLSPSIEVLDISTLGGIDVLATSSWSPIVDDAGTGGQFATVCRESGGTPHCTATWHSGGLVVRLAVTAWSGSIEADAVWQLLQGLLPTLIGNLAAYAG